MNSGSTLSEKHVKPFWSKTLDSLKALWHGQCALLKETQKVFLPAPCRQKNICKRLPYIIVKKVASLFNVQWTKVTASSSFWRIPMNTHKANLSRLLVNFKSIKPKIEKMIENARKWPCHVVTILLKLYLSGDMPVF